MIVPKVPALMGRPGCKLLPLHLLRHGWLDHLMCLQAVELALSSVASSQRPREPIRRLQSMRQTAAKAGNAVLGVGKFSAKVTAALPLTKYLHF